MANRSVLAYRESDSKLDLPSTALDFAALSGGEAASLTPKMYRFRSSISAYSDAAGTATLIIGAPAPGYEWEISRFLVNGGGSARVYVGTVQDSDELDFTATASEDVADEASPIFVPTGQNLIVQFTGAGATTLCTVSYQGKAFPL